jgi:hypothetical protein
VGVGGAVARVLDDRGPGAVAVERPVGEAHFGAQLHPVAHGDVAVAVFHPGSGDGVAQEVEVDALQALTLVEPQVGGVLAAQHLEGLAAHDRMGVVVAQQVLARAQAVPAGQAHRQGVGDGPVGIVGDVGEVGPTLGIGGEGGEPGAGLVIEAQLLARLRVEDRDHLDTGAERPVGDLGVLGQLLELVRLLPATAARRHTADRQQRHRHRRRQSPVARTPHTCPPPATCPLWMLLHR